MAPQYIGLPQADRSSSLWISFAPLQAKICCSSLLQLLHLPEAGTTATLDVLLKYFSYHQMPVVSSNYWPMVHGNTPDEVRKDAEGLQIMRNLGSEHDLAFKLY